MVKINTFNYSPFGGFSTFIDKCLFVDELHSNELLKIEIILLKRFLFLILVHRHTFKVYNFIKLFRVHYTTPQNNKRTNCKFNIIHGIMNTVISTMRYVHRRSWSSIYPSKQMGGFLCMFNRIEFWMRNNCSLYDNLLWMTQ